MQTPIKTAARTAGFLYLINIVFGIFAIGFISAALVVSNDATATAKNIINNESLYRLGIAAHIIILLTNIPLGVIFYRLFRVINVSLAQMLVFFTLVGTSVEAYNLVNEFAPLIILSGKSYLNNFTQPQLESIGYVFHPLEGAGFHIALVFFGFYCITIGYLIYKSRFFPKIPGIMLMIGGTCYLVNSFGTILSPAFAAKLVPYILIPSGVAELTFCIYMIIFGVREKIWDEARISAQ